MRKFAIFLMLFLTATLSFATENKTSQAPTKVKFTTSLGAFVVQVNSEKAPLSAANFLSYVNEGFYNGTIFHRVIPGFMAQGGGLDTSFKEKTGHPPIKNEAANGLKNKRGTVAMARTNVRDSANAQFFINFVDNGFLDYTSEAPNGWGYAVFGEVIEGMDVVDAMAKQATGDRNGMPNVPTKDIIIEKAEVMK